MLLAISVIAVEWIIHYKSLIVYKLGKSFRKFFRLQKTKKTDGPLVQEIEAFKCPISHKIMKKPVMTPYGHCFDKATISRWLRYNSYCPLTRQHLTEAQLVPCRSLKHAIKQMNQLTVINLLH